MSLRNRLAPSPHLWGVVRKMHLKTSKSPGSRHRPDTATLEKPLVLDPGLLRKVDMTRLTRDRLVTIENLITTPKKSRTSPKIKEKPEKKSRSKSGEGKSDREDEESSIIEDFKLNKPLRNATFRVRTHVRKGLREVFSSPSQLQVPSSEKQPKVKSPKMKSKNKSVEDVFGSLILNDSPPVPSPCNACGRSERPERLHAHPSMPLNKRSKLKEDQENHQVVQQKSSVMKPVAMKFRSGKTRGSKHPEVEKSHSEPLKSPVQKEKGRKSVPLIRRETFKIDKGSKPAVIPKIPFSPSPTRKVAVQPIPRRQALPRTPDKGSPKALPPAGPLPIPVALNPPVVHSASPRRPRTITCYLCQKQFGTASYPLHEPQCLQKWHRENQALPVGEQLPEPVKPASDPQWEQAWEAAQATMVQCEGCSKTFLPHRLEAHHRVCPQNCPVKKLSPAKQLQVSHVERDRDDSSERSTASEFLEGPTSIHCHICGRVFNRAAIEKHEQQCLKRWQMEHSSRDSSSSAAHSPAASPLSSAPSTPRRRMVICYLCGRQFGSASIAIHEPQCLRRWRMENDQLPSSQRRKEPQKPELVLDAVTGEVDYRATDEAQWQCHLVQLVPCDKCGRTFNPDRVVVHQKCCKGPKN